MLRFTIFGIPVEVDPMFWVVSFLMGGGFTLFSGEVNNVEVFSVLVWVVVVFISILIHELGHTITSRKLGGGSTWIKLWAFGGLAYHQGTRFSQKNRAIMIAMGPGAGFLLFIVVLVIGLFVLGPSIAIDLALASSVGILDSILDAVGVSQILNYSNEFKDFTSNPSNFMKLKIFYDFFLVNCFWGLINLLPVLPLDGGKLVENYHRSPKKVYLIGIISALIVVVISAAVFKSVYMVVLFGYLGYSNFNAYQEAKY
jgi:stage IV sporulation protein FB